MGWSSHIAGYAESNRNLLGHQPGSATMVMSVPGSGQNAYVDRQSLKVLSDQFLGVGPGLILRPAARDGYGVVVRPPGKTSSVGSYANEIREVFTFTVPDQFDTRVANANISADGSAVVVATDSDIGAWVHRDGQVLPTLRHLAAPDHPVFTHIDNDGTAVAIGASGAAHYADGRDEQLITPESPVVTAAVTASGATILVAQNGWVWTKSGDRYESTLSVGRSFGAFATAISADDTLLAVIGGDSTSILDLIHHRQVALVQRNFRGLVHDVSFDDDGKGFTYIREDAAVGHRTLSPPDQLGKMLDSRAPRALTDEERRTFIDAQSSSHE